MEAMSSKAMDTRRQMGGVNAGKESSLAVNKQVKQLENRLEKVGGKSLTETCGNPSVTGSGFSRRTHKPFGKVETLS